MTNNESIGTADAMRERGHSPGVRLLALTRVDRLVLTAVLALVVAGVMLGVVDAGTFPGETAGVTDVVWVVGGAFAATLVPFLLFVSHLLRVLPVAKRTLAIGPLILRESQR